MRCKNFTEGLPFVSKPAIAQGKKGLQQVCHSRIAPRVFSSALAAMVVGAALQNSLLSNVCKNAGYVSYTIASDELKRTIPSACPIVACYLLIGATCLTVYAIEWARAQLAANSKNRPWR